MLTSKLGPPVIGPYVAGRSIFHERHGMYLAWSSTQGGMNSEAKVVPGGITEQAEQALTNLKNFATESGFDVEHDGVKCTVFLADMGDFGQFNEVYKRYFTKEFPARTCVAVKSLPAGLKVGVEAVFFRQKH